MVKYIKPGEVGEFIYRDTHFEKYNYESWSYDVLNQDTSFEKKIYESNGRATFFHSFPTNSCD